MNNENVPLLTAEQAKIVMFYDPSTAHPQLRAIADGRAIVVPRMSEAEAFEKYASSERFGDDLWGGYLAALRDIGAIRD